MSLQRITFKHTQTEVNHRLEDLITEKLQALDRTFGGKREITAEVEFAKVAPKQNGDIYKVAVTLRLGSGAPHRAEAIEDTFEKAIDQVRNEIEAEVKRIRTKRQSMWRKGARKIKDMMRFGN